VNEADEQLKGVVDFTAKKLQTPLNHFIRSIQNAKAATANGKKSKEAEKKGGKNKADKNSDGITSARVYLLLSLLMLFYSQSFKVLIT
jgi:hypothetical protein